MSSSQLTDSRATKRDSLMLVRKLGFNPALVFDIGAQRGTFELYEVFPRSLHVLVEPVVEHEPWLKEICAKLPQATYILAAASKSTGEGTLRVTKNAMFAGLDYEATFQQEATHTRRQIQTIAIDDLVQSMKFTDSILLKIDVDGRELDVLHGAKQTLKQVGYAVVEATTFGDICEIIAFMNENGFALYDILEPLYRPLDGALWQVDLAFVPKDSFLRSQTAFAAPDELRKMQVGS